jgi:hypothetical protein
MYDVVSVRACTLHSTQSVCGMWAMALACVASISSLASCMGPLARIHDDEVVVSWQVGVATGSPASMPVSVHMHAVRYTVSVHPPCMWCQEVQGGRCSYHPLDLDVDGLVPAPLVPPTFPCSCPMSVTGLALALTWHDGCGM